MSQGNLRWNDIEVTWSDDNVDFFVIINAPWPDEFYIPERTIVFQMEPWCCEPWQTWGVKTWGEWAAPDSARFLQVRRHETHLNNAFWQLKSTYSDLRTKPIEKTKCLASICSPKYFDPGHIKRVDFLKYLEAVDDEVVRVDIYAYENPLGFKNWVGPTPPGEKDAALLPYRYFFAAENNQEHNYVTEKLWEPLLTETLCFYWGAPNAAEWIDQRAYVPIDLNDFEQAFLTMKQAILANAWEKRLDIIRTEKRKVLEHYQFFPTLERILRNEAESRVLSSGSNSACSLHDSGIDHYRATHPESRYSSASPESSVSGVEERREPAESAPGESIVVERPTICLVMIVKDEAHIIAEALASLLPYITDYVIVDTGSTDPTKTVITRFFSEHGIGGTIFDRPWRDFGSNRSEAMALARTHSTATYLWMHDADDIVEGQIDIHKLSDDAYHLRFGPDFEYWRLQIFRRSLPWRYEGVLHEYSVCDAPANHIGHLEGDYYINSRRLGSRSRDPEKYERDAAILDAASTNNPNDTRTTFYLAQSWYDAERYDKALEVYRRRAAQGGWAEEVFYSRYRAALCLEHLGRPYEEVQTELEACHREHPHRAEPLVRAATRARLASHFDAAYVLARRAARVPKAGANGLFVDLADYEYRALDEQAMAAFYCGFPEEAFELCTEMLDHRELPEGERSRIEQNRDYSVPLIKSLFLQYDTELMASLAARPKSPEPEVTLVVTSCRRLDLFTSTLCSFLNACTDIELVDRFLCVDDNSSAEDRETMQRLFPFFEFIFKGPEDGGHARSLNLIREAVRTPWVVHLEDDWHFFAQRNYISEAIEVLVENPELGQVLFNRNYAETLADRTLPGGSPKRTAGHGYRYVVHEHYPVESEAYDRFQASHGRSSNAWWPHYSLRPAVVRASVYARVGAFDEAAGHFELDYARRYEAAGFRSAFFDGIYSLHTGRLTSERDNPNKLNAYDLNRKQQFDPGGQQPTLPDADTPVDTSAPLRIKFINLDRRADRKDRLLKHLQTVTSPHFVSRVERFPAFDAQELTMTPEIHQLFQGNDFGYRRSYIACALSHMALWSELVGETAGAFLILEDDVTLADDFEDRFEDLYSRLSEIAPAFDLVLLGHSQWNPIDPNMWSGQVEVGLSEFRGNQYLGGLFAYLLSKNGARRLMKLIDRDGVQNGIDRFVQLKENELNIWVSTPHLARSTLVYPGSGLDSDIQHDFEVLGDPTSRT